MKKSTAQSPYHTRVDVPKIAKDEQGNAVLLCPFCVPTHPLNPSSPSACGTRLVLTAEQTVIRAKYAKNLICVKCGKGGGKMVVFQNSYIHIHDCNPGVMAMREPPRYSRFAQFINTMPNQFVKKQIEKFTGRAMPVEEVDPKGVKTGKILGYFFWKPKKEVSHAKRIETPA